MISQSRYHLILLILLLLRTDTPVFISLLSCFSQSPASPSSQLPAPSTHRPAPGSQHLPPSAQLPPFSLPFTLGARPSLRSHAGREMWARHARKGCENLEAGNCGLIPALVEAATNVVGQPLRCVGT